LHYAKNTLNLEEATVVMVEVEEAWVVRALVAVGLEH